MDKGLGRGEDFVWPLDLSARFYEEFETGTFFPLQTLDANLVRRHPGNPDSSVCGPHQSDGDPTIGISACPRVALPTRCCEAGGYPFQGSCRLHIQQLVYGCKERGRSARVVGVMPPSTSSYSPVPPPADTLKKMFSF